MADREERITEQTTVDNGRVVRERSVNTKSSNYVVTKAAQIVWFIVGALVFLLLVRMGLSLLGANPANTFADLIYSLSNPFVAPFRGLLQVGTVTLGVSRFELETLVAVGVYTLFGWGLVKLINLARKDNIA